MSDTNTPPESWAQCQRKLKKKWLIPFAWFEHQSEWISFYLGRWALLDVLEYLGKLSLLVGLILWLWEIPARKQANLDQRKSKQYQAWQAINTAQGSAGNGGRLNALQDLNDDGIDLAFVKVAGAELSGIVLTNASLHHADISHSMMVGANLEGANLALSVAIRAQLRESNLRRANLLGADLTEASLAQADVMGANLSGALLIRTDLKGLRNWNQIADIRGAHLSELAEPPPGFLAWATNQGATLIATGKPAAPPNTPPPVSSPAGAARHAVIKDFLKKNPRFASTNDLQTYHP
jgi:uncharacterized protein YjbI with pentapeptide repeats